MNTKAWGHNKLYIYIFGNFLLHDIQKTSKNFQKNVRKIKKSKKNR